MDNGNARLTRFEAFSKDAGLSPLYSRLTEKDREACREFIRNHDHLDRNGFAAAVNSWKLGGVKPKRFTDMWALVLQSNGVELRQRRA